MRYVGYHVYHVYKNVNWENVNAIEKVTIESENKRDSIKIDPYCCVIKAMAGNPAKLVKACLLFLEKRKWKSGGVCFLHKI